MCSKWVLRVGCDGGQRDAWGPAAESCYCGAVRADAMHVSLFSSIAHAHKSLFSSIAHAHVSNIVSGQCCLTCQPRTVSTSPCGSPSAMNVGVAPFAALLVAVVTAAALLAAALGTPEPAAAPLPTALITGCNTGVSGGLLPAVPVLLLAAPPLLPPTGAAAPAAEAAPGTAGAVALPPCAAAPAPAVAAGGCCTTLTVLGPVVVIGPCP